MSICSLLSGLSAVPTAGGSQETGSIAGMVLDQQNLEPIAGALVLFSDSTHGIRADSQGRFQLFDVPAGDVMMRVEADGYVTFVETVAIAAMEESLIHFHLHRLAAVLDLLLVDVSRSDGRERGHTEAEIGGNRLNLRSAADMLMMNVPGLTAGQPQGAVGTGVQIRIRGVGSFLLSEEPQVYLDGARIDAGGMDAAMLTLAEIPAASVRRIRVLRGPASTSMYPNAAAGVILVETMGR